MRHALRVLGSVVVAAAVAVPAVASSVAPPANLGELARLSRAVVLGRALQSWSEPGATFPWTVTRFELLRQVSGESVLTNFDVREPGGVSGDRTIAIGGAARYEPGRTYLLFLDKDGQDRLRSRMLSYGTLVEDAASGTLSPVREAGQVRTVPNRPFEPVGVYQKEALLQHLAQVARGAAWERSRVEALPGSGPSSASAELINPPAGCSFLTFSDGFPARFFGYETGASSSISSTTPGQAGIGDGGVGAVQAGINAWTNHADSKITYNYAGSIPANITCTASQDAQLGGVVFNDPCGDIPALSGCAGTLAYGGLSATVATQTFDGEAWHQGASTFIVVNDGTQCIGSVSFAEMVAHELGHTQGFGHHAVAPDPNNPTMSAVLKGDGRGAALVGLDRTCASFAYHTFLDVPINAFGWAQIEALENASITAGCGGGMYCPDSSVTREQMAIFLLRARNGSAYLPPPCGTPSFSDVPCSSIYAAWINELFAQNITAGCDVGLYCPTSPVTREQMAIFLLRAFEGPGYMPPACPATATFTDVPCPGSPYARFIEELSRRGITAGCTGGNYCPTSPVTRAQMAFFLWRTFSLTLPQ